jgi:hypothetical protein
VRPPPPTAALAVLLAALAPGPAALAAPPASTAIAPAAAGEPEPLDPRIAACLLSRLDRARTETSADLLFEACAALVGPTPAGGEGASFLVECRVSGDPEWARVRLLTRRQCAAAGGRAGAAD